MTGTRLSADTRGLSTAVTHTLAVGITAILIVGLLLATQTYLADQREQAAEDQLETIGSALAERFRHVERLSQQGGSTSLTSTQPEQIVGQPYTVSVASGSDCPPAAAAGSANACIVLSMASPDVTTAIPLHNESELGAIQREDGTIKLTATPSPSAGDVAYDRGATGNRIGVGSNVDEDSTTQQIRVRVPPIPRFTVRPATPMVNTSTSFDASASDDLDGTIAEYRWDFDGDGTVDNTTTTPTIPHTFTTPGPHPVELNVTDEDGLTQTTNQTLLISGLVYRPNQTQLLADENGNPDRGISIALTNQWASEVTITDLVIDPSDSAISSLQAPGEHEITTSDGEWVEYGNQPVPENGLVVDLDHPGSGSGVDDNPTVDPGDTIDFDVRYFDAQIDQDIAFAVRYKVDDDTIQSTTFRTAVGTNPNIPDYRLTALEDAVKLRFTSTQELDPSSIEIDVTKPTTTTTLNGSNLTESRVGTAYQYTATIVPSQVGTVRAELTQATDMDGNAVTSHPVDEVYTGSTSYRWYSAAHWDNAVSESNVDHTDSWWYPPSSVELVYWFFNSGVITTDWRSAKTLDSTEMYLDYSTVMDDNDDITVVVQSDTDSDPDVDESSNPVVLSDGEHTADVESGSLSGTNSKYRLRITFSSDGTWPPPTLYYISLQEDDT